MLIGTDVYVQMAVVWKETRVPRVTPKLTDLVTARPSHMPTQDEVLTRAYTHLTITGQPR